MSGDPDAQIGAVSYWKSSDNRIRPNYPNLEHIGKCKGLSENLT